MQKPINFNKKLLATAVTSYALLGMSGQALAQDGNVEEVVVTGIRASIQASMDVKRNAVGVVDAITAEDIGKMPDTNLAESLQRIPGVSIDRVNGEGSKVTVRGLAGDYNLVTLNGRQMPASSFGTSRSFDFANLASEGVSGVEVYKSGRADVQSGGMGALINIVTPRPLKSPGLKATVGVKGVYDESSTKDDITPEISGLFSNTFADDTIGVAVTASYQERNSGANAAEVGGWFVHDKDGKGSWADVPAGMAPAGKTYAIPVNIGYSMTEVNRKRLNGQLTLQYKPVEQLTVTADYLYVNQETETDRHATGMWYNRGPIVDVEWSDTEVAYPISYTEESGYHEIDSSMAYNLAKSDLKSSGLNVKWDATDHLTLELDAHHSTSFSGPNGKWGNDNTFNNGVFYNYRTTTHFDTDIPYIQLGYADQDLQPGYDHDLDPDTDKIPLPIPNTGSAPDLSREQLTGNSFKVRMQDSTVDEYQLKGSYSFDDNIIESVQFGLGANEIDNRYFFLGHQMQNQGSWNGVQGENGVGDIPATYWHTDKLSNYFSLPTGTPDLFNTFVRADWNELVAAGATLYGSADNNNGACPWAYCATTDLRLKDDGFADQKTVEESSWEYIQFNLAHELGGMPAHLTIGVRHETTDVKSTSYLPQYSNLIQWNGGNEYSLVALDEASESEKGAYEKTLPNLDFDIAVTEDIKLRASASKTIARPNYDQIKGGFVWNSSPRFAQGEASKGNPDLDPLESTNFDFSAEWYYADASYVSMGVFKKKVVDFIGNGVLNITSDFHTVYNGPRWQEAAAAVGNDQAKIQEYILEHFPESSDAVSKHIFALEEDPLLPFVVNTPVNNKEVNLKGVELAIQHTFESGFGFQANYTNVDSDVAFDNVSVEDQFAIYGLSDSANLVGFYDANGLQVRIAYNWRDSFLASKGDNQGDNPRYTDAYGQLDASISYDLTDNLVISLEGLNLTDEKLHQYGRDKHMLYSNVDAGARYNLGVRYTF